MRLGSKHSIARAFDAFLHRNASRASPSYLVHCAANVAADPADDALAKLNQLSRQAEQTTEAMHSAQLDLNDKLAAQQAADKKHADDQAAVDGREGAPGHLPDARSTSWPPRRTWADASTA